MISLGKKNVMISSYVEGPDGTVNHMTTVIETRCVYRKKDGTYQINLGSGRHEVKAQTGFENGWTYEFVGKIHTKAINTIGWEALKASFGFK